MTRLEELPARIDDLQLQILQFREETRSEFSAVRREMREGFEEAQRQFGEVDRRFGEVTRQFDVVNNQIEQTRVEMRVLHEEVIRRIALLGEAGGPQDRAGSRRTRKRR